MAHYFQPDFRRGSAFDFIVFQPCFFVAFFCRFLEFWLYFSCLGGMVALRFWVHFVGGGFRAFCANARPFRRGVRLLAFFTSAHRFLYPGNRQF